MRPWAALVVPARLDGPTLEAFCELLTRLNQAYLREHPRTPPLYRSGVRYELQDEYWLTIPWALEFARWGHGVDCKVLAAWRAAELRHIGDGRARCAWSCHRAPDMVVYHVTVVRGDGRHEDPSAELGMGSVLPQGGAAWSLSP